MWGHATIEEKKIIQELEKKIDFTGSPIESLIELSILYIEPCHNYEKAIELIKSILVRDPENEMAKILMAFCCIHFLMLDADLEYGEKLLNEVISNGNENKGAAYKLLAEVLKDLDKVTFEEEINYLELSVKYEPNWSSNHEVLSTIYEKVGNFQKALEHMRIAISNISGENNDWSLAQYYYESIMTGRVSVRKYLEIDLKKMIEKSHKKKWSIFKRKKK